jgi:FixJ family two-component response regulator
MPDVPLTVFVVDDDEDIRTSLSRALEKRGFTVECHTSAQSFLAAYNDGRTGCLILDYGMPGMNGLELQEHLTTLNMPIPIIFITGHGGIPESVQAMRGGAIDFLEKPFRQSTLVERVEAALAIALDRHSTQERSRHQQALLGRLTARELEIVERIVGAPSESSSKDIASYLGISPRTVDHHRARILEKLHIRSIAELIALVKD